jgi:hypothetical protein
MSGPNRGYTVVVRHRDVRAGDFQLLGGLARLADEILEPGWMTQEQCPARSVVGHPETVGHVARQETNDPGPVCQDCDPHIKDP